MRKDWTRALISHRMLRVDNGFSSAIGRLSPMLDPIIRSYQGESTGSHPNSEVKHPWACSVLRWGTTWESQVMYVLHFCKT